MAEIVLGPLRAFTRMLNVHTTPTCIHEHTPALTARDQCQVFPSTASLLHFLIQGVWGKLELPGLAKPAVHSLLSLKPAFRCWVTGTCHHGWPFMWVLGLGCGSLCWYKKHLTSQAVVAHTFNPSTWEAEAGGSLWV